MVLIVRGEVITAYTADVVRASEGSYTMPIGAKIEVDIPNDHLGYALTWYGLAVALIGVYGVWHHQAGRLSFQEVKRDAIYQHKRRRIALKVLRMFC